MEKIHTYIDLATEKIIHFTPKVIIAIIVFWLGYKLIKKLEKPIDLIFSKAGLTNTIRPFLISLVSFLLYVVLFFILAGILSINLSVFGSIIAASVFAIGMSLQGSLGNFASGLLVLSLKPYEADDYIQVDDKFGKVDKIDIFNTVVSTPGNKTLIIPNAKMTSEIITNYSKKSCILLDITVSIPYEESFPRVKQIIEDCLSDVPEILKEPKLEIGITKFESHSVTVSVWPYIHPKHYWPATFKVHENIKRAFSENNVKVAYTEGFELGKIGN